VKPLAVQPWELTSEAIVPDVIVDIRTREQFDRGHISGAIHLPYERFQVDADSMLSAEGLVLVVDPAGARAAEMAVWLRGTGRNVCYLKGGMAAWRGPLESE
jgi:rhodanese-related sulfurtransferase